MTQRRRDLPGKNLNSGNICLIQCQNRIKRAVLIMQDFAMIYKTLFLDNNITIKLLFKKSKRR